MTDDPQWLTEAIEAAEASISTDELFGDERAVRAALPVIRAGLAADIEARRNRWIDEGGDTQDDYGRGVEDGFDSAIDTVTRGVS